MYASFSFQNVKITEASCFEDLESVPFFLKFVTTNNGGDGSYGEFCAHIGNAPLALALVKAVNDTLKEFAKNEAEILALANAHLDGIPIVQPPAPDPNLEDEIPF